ncbi:N-carbamoyl-L-amino-acid hydrolase [Sphaerotilus hippei]|uniref:N-carbamoyl-L-amino-acid hydrolase n=1 Tax=Sphaerotilus hippei TaxID=744406 RepID=A0A318H355_9BURK|nr:2-oxo-4-hydroxy-4-carboxy-5-ureidoimidazoline decarboxylase [Sphaerotilus hippei]PXW92844.1 N-carbamoyl-L-amino-acid hydrolase [Sphaerotilus hippei]
MHTPLDLHTLNAADQPTFVALLDGTYEHSPWVAERAWARRPAGGHLSLAHLLHDLACSVREASEAEQLALIRAHPELAGKAMVAQSLTAESTDEQSRAGLTACSPEEFSRLQQLNTQYNGRFGWPFILAVRGPRGTGLTRQQIIATFERRLHGSRDTEFAESLRNIHRIAQIRLTEKLALPPRLGQQVWDWCEAWATHTEAQEPGQLTVTYLTAAHQACARQLADWMREAGFDEVGRDAVGNVVGLYHAASGPGAPRLLTGSHYDTVRQGGRYDGRLGILVAVATVRELARAGRRLPYSIEVVGFAEEEGQRYKATFLGSSALTGSFDPAWLEQTDAAGIPMHAAMRAAGLPGEMSVIQDLARDVSQYLGFVEVHIEQGPVLDEELLPLGIVTSINGSARYLGEVTGQASHAGTTPMNRRRDAATAVAELALYAEARALADEDSVATVGLLQVPDGSINVVPGRCRFSLDLRAPRNTQRNALVADIRQQLTRIAERRRVGVRLEETMVASAAPSAAPLQALWERAVQSLGLPLFHLPSGAGHDAMKLHEIMPQAMLFVRGENGGISHNPLESTTCDDMQLACEAFDHLLHQLAEEHP